MNNEMNNIKELPTSSRLLRLKEVIQVTGISRSSLYKYLNEGQFPPPISLGARSVAWIDHEIQAWITTKMKQRSNKAIQNL
ncbi:AlpA family transcriptional regulator [Vibrio celticus]|uniref:Prophage CP4-57 regulatory protein (AlpA) n=1 Tax=Vibrio celticus TaxID=446372 RepID=A0A1C3JA67_9VIBR|nr:AlpA family transcriptional regulator [Vibrio celticus]SBT11947.1 Prophage CP4-57 regulatory protein (AlpA) [Vibrio celticus]